MRVYGNLAQESAGRTEVVSRLLLGMMKFQWIEGLETGLGNYCESRGP